MWPKSSILLVAVWAGLQSNACFALAEEGSWWRDAVRWLRGTPEDHAEDELEAVQAPPNQQEAEAPEPQALPATTVDRGEPHQVDAAQPAPVADRKGEDGFRALYTINRDGSGVQYLVAAPGMISSSSPEWSHDGTMVAFDAVPEVGALSQAHIFVYAVAGPFKGMFKDLGCGNVPSWSPDDRKIAYMLNSGNPAGAEPGVWVMDSDGSDREWICRGYYARWSPDGRQLCVYAYFEDSLHIVDMVTKEIRKILGGPMEVKFGGATWSPDGKRLVFVGTRDGKEHLATVDADGLPDSIKILHTQGDSSQLLIGPPSWSPDGKQIAFAIQDASAPDPRNRRWHHTYLYVISAEAPSFPTLLEPGRKGLINRSMMWSPDSETLVFSSER
jgi:Tol biopolymer transport system component